MQEREPGDLTGGTGLPTSRRALLYALLALSVCAAFWSVLRGEFVYDDLLLVAQNPSLQTFGKMWASLGGSYWDFLDARSAQFVGYWRPLTTISLYLGNLLGNGDPTAFHAISLGLHVIATWLAFELARRLLRNTTSAVLVALLFGLHPVQVEPVAWISSVNDPLQGLFSLAALLAFVAWRERGSRGLPLGAAGLFLCALLSKESALAVLPLALAIDVGRAATPAEQRPWRARLQPFVRPYATLFATFALYYAARCIVFGDLLAGFDRSTGQIALSTGRQWSLRVELLGGAIGLLAWPKTLNLFRDTRPEIPWSDATLWIAVLAIALFALAIWLAWRARRSTALCGLLIVPAALLPALLRIEALGRFSLSERYLYVSTFGFALAGVALLTALAERIGLRRLSVFALLLAVLACAWRSEQRTHVWRDERTLFSQSYLDNPNSPFVAWGLGRILLNDYKNSQQLEYLQQARDVILHSQDLGLKDEHGERDPEVLVTEEDRLQANLGLAWYYFFAALRGYDETTLDEALAVFQKTLSFFPRSFEAMTGCGMVMLSQGNLVGAKAELEAALALNPKHQEAWFYLGKLEKQRGDLPAARQAFEHALEIKRDDAETLPYYAGVLAEMGDKAGAQRAYDRAYELAPENPLVLFGLGMLAADGRDGAAAVAWFDRLLRLAPDFAPAHLQKGKVLLAMGQTQRGVTELQRACELNPRDFEAYYSLGAVLASQGMAKEALQYLEHALEVDPQNAVADELRSQIELLKKQ